MGKLKYIIIPVLIIELAAAGFLIYRRGADSVLNAAPQPTNGQEYSAEAEQEPEEEASISLGGQDISLSSEALELNSSVTVAELKTALPQFQMLSKIDASACSFSDDEKRNLLQDYPGIAFEWTVDVAGQKLPGSASLISITGDNIQALAEKADLLPKLESIVISDGEYVPSQLEQLRSACPGAVIDCALNFFGQSFSSLEQELDFSERKTTLEETEQFKSLVPLMPNLNKVIMSDCGLSDEEMDALNKSYEDVRFVWTVHFKVYSVRTDSTYFCVSDLPWNNYVCVGMTDKEFAPIKYCTDMEALDLGHENIASLDFVYSMPKLKFLIIITAHNKLDLTPLASLTDLYYLEVFNNEVIDFSPLLECKNLKHLNIGYCRGGFSLDPIKQMTQLDRLWYPGNNLSEEEMTELENALPNTFCYLRPNGESGSTGGGWRDGEEYRELRRALHMPYVEADGTQVKFRD